MFGDFLRQFWIFGSIGASCPFYNQSHLLPPFSSSRTLICLGVEQRALPLSKCRCLCDPGVSYDCPEESIVISFPMVTESYNGKHVISFRVMRCFSGEGNSLFSHSVMSDSLRPHGLQLPCTRLPCPSLSPWVCSNACPLSQWSRPTTSSSVVPFSYSPSFQHQDLFQWIGSSHQEAKVLEPQLRHQSFQWIFKANFL